MYYILDDKKNPVAVEITEAADWWTIENRRVALDTVGSYEVSTVFLGIDHGYGANDAPILFETMVFGDGPRLDETHRYTTWQEALEGHQKLVEELKND